LPHIYFPILDRIADGYFDSSTTDEQLYNSFLKLLKDDDLITNSESLSSFKFALAIRNAAPRIEAHYQYYNTAVEPLLNGNQCDAWIELDGKQSCDPTLETGSKTKLALSQKVLSFDRVLGSGPDFIIATLYADITSPAFRQFHKTASQNAQEGKSLYRVRYKPTSQQRDPLPVSGYGVELALKRTDYIVIDDRPKGDGDSESISQITLDDEAEVDDLKPLSSADLKDLGMKAGSFVAESEDPLDALLKLTRDFPKYSSSLVSRNDSEDFLREHLSNRETALPAGFNILWVNGVQYDPRKVDAFSLIDHMRRERKLINDFRDMGLSSAEAITLLSNDAIVEAYRAGGNQRYDWRDEIEGGDVILYLNDLTKDKRYRDWPEESQAVSNEGFGYKWLTNDH
jgi:UDP-glucose:glycoprotein glucosyltransferase